jgi:hypothetical protein
MLFGDGQKTMMFSTHPPMNDRISRVDPGFQPEELDRLAARIQRDQTRVRAKAEQHKREVTEPRPGMFDADHIIDQIGQPDWDRLLMAAAITASIPENIVQAAHSTEWAPEVLFYSLLDTDEEVRERQLLIVTQKMGGDSEAQVRALLQSGGLPSPEQRLPLLEVAFPALKRRPPDFVARVLDTVESMVDADDRIDVFEYLLARSISMHLRESANPHRVRTAGHKTISNCRRQAASLLAVLAHHGQVEPGDAKAAFGAGIKALGVETDTVIPDVDDWVAALDTALPKLDLLKSLEKEKLVRAMSEVVLHDGRLAATELELLRLSCDMIHVPLPLLTAPR